MKLTSLLAIVHICLILFVASVPICFAGDADEGKGVPDKESSSMEKVEVITLGSMEQAEKFAGDLEKSGYKTMIVTVSNQVYKVFILINKKDLNNPQPSGGLSQGAAENKTMQNSYEADQSPSWDVLGKQHHYVHASLTLSGVYTDNALNSRTNKQSDFSTILSPQIWLGFPLGLNLGPLSLSLRSPGGSLLTRQMPDSQSHLQASLYYMPNFTLSSSSGGLAYGDVPSQTLGGSILLLGNRFSLLTEDQYEFAHQAQEAGSVTLTGKDNRYNSNLFNAALSYESRSRLGFQVGYSNFITRYNSELSSFQDRQDNTLYASVSYKLSPKMRLIADYRYLNIAYDKSNELDSNEHYLMAGIEWDITAKSKGLLKVGYEVKDFEHTNESFGDFSFEAQIDHSFTPRTSFSLRAFRKTSETNVSGMAFSVTDGLETKLQHSVNPRLTSSAGFLIMSDNYKTWPDLTGGFDSMLYQVNLALQYSFRRWLKGGIGYAYTIRNSSEPELQYRSNAFYFNITVAM